MVHQPPTPLILTLIASIGTAIFAGLQAGGEPIIILIIPFTVLAAFLFGADAGIIVGVGSGIITALLLKQIQGWELVVYTLGAAVVGYVTGTYVTKKHDTVQLLAFIFVGTLILEIMLNVYAGKTFFLRSEEYLGTSAASGLRLIINLVIGGLLAAWWLPDAPAAPAKK
ncbi:MAG: hypothetical protein IPJ89_05655 [Candidatus Iainarchaeum archaeon]|uniref:Uncharacterized protein n=1 Tax=Candidatus Iainarchaeum sp. TaxID=3101447 RepID=A0A7T9I2C2_9ARCH|nr:MAG: hypothetical protein IPJ89_05655 [Candidatus Diapherotrites archaeon]